MGGAVISLMDWKNRRSLSTHHEIVRCKEYGVNSVAVSGTDTATSSAIWRNSKLSTNADLKEWREKTYNGPNQTQRFVNMCESSYDKVAIHYRLVDKVVKEDVPVGPKGEKKTLDITYLKPRQEMTYGTLLQNAQDFSRGLAELGLNARENISIYEETRWEWIASIYGIWLQDMVASTVYANLGEDALFYALRETECKAIVCNGHSVPNLLRGVAAGSFPPCTIIYLDALPTEGTDGDANPHNCRVVAWTDVVAMGAKAKETRTVVAPKDNDSIALIMYTSGTTGDPKGVMHSHGSLTAGILVMDHWLWSCVDQVPNEVYCSYLPLAHILEFGVVNIFLARQSLVCFGSPRTLTDMTARPTGDLVEFKPTLMVGVPRIFDTLKRAVEAQLPPLGSLKRQVFDHAYKVRLAAIKEGMDTPYYNEKVFKLARAALGGRMRAMLSGGGPLAESTQKFINVVFCPIVVGWGLTETICCGAIGRVGDLELGSAGQVLAAEELKLVDTENYKHTDKPNPRGELCVRGPFMFKGYYKQPELTKEVLDEETFFHTGDIGTINSDGKVRIIGRVKALAKNCLGEYIAMEMLESIYSNHPLVLNNCLCVLVHPDKNYICAIGVTDEGKAINFAKTEKLPIPMKRKAKGSDKEEPDVPALLHSCEFRKRAASSLCEMAKATKRQRFEYVRNLCLVTDSWTPENGILTAAMKIRRGAVAEKYEEEIDELFHE